nr:hypothetical protein [Pirellula sp.]
NGDYAVAGLQPGVYGFVAAGESGFVATAFEFVANKSEPVNVRGEKLIGIFRPCRFLNAERIPYRDVVAVDVVQTEVVEVVEAPAEVVVESGTPMPGYGAGMGWGGFGGGGGGGSGMAGGGWGGIAGIAGLAAVAGILAAEDDNEAPVVSPAVP